MEYNFPSGGHDPMDWNAPPNFETIYAQLAPDAVQYAVEHICTMNGLRPTPGLIERLEREEELNAVVGHAVLLLIRWCGDAAAGGGDGPAEFLLNTCPQYSR